MKRSTIGLAPGTLVYEGKEQKTLFRVLTYDGVSCQEVTTENLDELPLNPEGKKRIWIQVIGLGDVQKLQELGTKLGLSSLLLEDTLSSNQRPKVEFLEGYDFICLRHYALRRKQILSQQVSIFINDAVVVTFQDTFQPLFEPLEMRFAQRQSRLQKFGSSYLGYALIDYLVDQYFLVQEFLEEVIEQLSRDIHLQKGTSVRDELYRVRMELLSFRKFLLPLSEIVDRFLKHKRYVNTAQSIEMYLGDLRDHVLHLQELVKAYTETLESLSTLYFSITADKTNSVMQILTAITITFLPLTFLAGVYGMNFRYMPELEFKWGYPIVWGVMFVIAGLILWIFKKKKWL